MATASSNSSGGVIRGHFYRLNGDLLADGYVELPFSSRGTSKEEHHHRDVAAVKAFLASEVDERRPLASLIELFHLDIDSETGSAKTDEVGVRLTDNVLLADLANGKDMDHIMVDGVDSCAVEEVVDPFQHVDHALIMNNKGTTPCSKRSTKSTMCASEDEDCNQSTMPLESTMCASDDDDESHWNASFGSTAHPMSVASPREHFGLSSPRDFLASQEEEVPEEESAADLLSTGLVRSLFETSPAFGMTGLDSDAEDHSFEIERPKTPTVRGFGFSPPSRGSRKKELVPQDDSQNSSTALFKPPSRSNAGNATAPSTSSAETTPDDNPVVKKRSVRITTPSPSMIMTSDAESTIDDSVVDLHFRYVIKHVDFEALGVQRDLTLRKLNELGLDKCREWVWQQSYREHILWDKICRGGSRGVGSDSTDRLFSFICKNKLAPNVAVAMAEHLREEGERMALKAKERSQQAELEREVLRCESYLSDEEATEDSGEQSQKEEEQKQAPGVHSDESARELDAMLNYVDETGRSCLMWTLLWQNERASMEIVKNQNFRQICQTDVWGGTALSLALPLCGQQSDDLFLSLLGHADLQVHMVDDALSSAKFISAMDLGFCFLGEDTNAKARCQWRNTKMQEWKSRGKNNLNCSTKSLNCSTRSNFVRLS